MPPKVDPYATPVQRRIDALLIVIIAITVAILLLTGSHGRAADDSANSDVQNVQNASR
jgi:outer membrane murein-binding lipoprotein Lpp